MFTVGGVRNSSVYSETGSLADIELALNPDYTVEDADALTGEYMHEIDAVIAAASKPDSHPHLHTNGAAFSQHTQVVFQNYAHAYGLPHARCLTAGCNSAGA
jgi:hypothetical protein